MNWQDDCVVVTVAGKLISTERACAALMGYSRPTVGFYDFGPKSPPDAVTPTDIGRLIVIEALQQNVVVPLLKAGDDAPWHLVGHDARLEDADPEGALYSQATDLHDHFTGIPGVGFAIASKLLHLKRPSFFPLLDSRIRDVYGPAAKAQYQRSDVWKARRPKWDRLYWAAIRADLVNPANTAALSEIRARLGETLDPHAELLTQLNDLRILDILAWWAGESANED